MMKRMGMMTVAMILSKSNSSSRLIRLLGLFHGMVAFKPRMTQSCGTLLSDWLTSTDVHVDGFSVSVTVSSGSRTSEEDDIAVVNLFGWVFFQFFFFRSGLH